MLTFELWKSFLTDDEFVSYNMFDELFECCFFGGLFLISPLTLLADIILIPLELIILIKHIVKR